MRRLQRIALVGAWSLLCSGTQAAAQPPGPEPALELHRTAAASHWDPGRGDLLFVLVIGSDIRAGDPASGRADTLRLIALNPATMQGATVGIPRDSWVDVPGLGQMKITESLHRGGPLKVVETVQNLAGVPIHYWVLTEFSRFVEMGNRLGGVTVDVPYPMSDAFSGANFAAGPNHLDGGAALAFARNRYGVPGGDFGRSENHGRLLLAGLAKFRAEAADALRLLVWLQVFREFVVSNVGTAELMNLALLGRRLDPSSLQNVVLPGAPGTAGGQSVVHLAPQAHELLAALRDDARI